MGKGHVYVGVKKNMSDETEKTEYEEDLEVNKYALDYEWARQPMLYYKWACRFAQAVKERARTEERLRLVKTEAKRRLEEKKAKIDAAIRKDFRKYGFQSKPTEAAITGRILLDPEFKKEVELCSMEVERAVEDYLEKLEREEILAGAKTAFSHKKTALEYESQLWLASYFAEPKIPAEARKRASEESRDLHEEQLSEAMLKSRKGR